MAILIERTIACPPETVLACIREETRECRESAVPAELRATGVLKVDSHIRGNKFRLDYERGIGGPRYDFVVLRGTVDARTDGKTLLRGRCGRDRDSCRP